MEDTFKIDEKIITTIYLCARYQPDSNYLEWRCSDYNMADLYKDEPEKGWLLVANTNVTFYPSIRDLRQTALKTLEAHKEKLLADHHMALKAVDDKIQSLLAITYQAAE